MRKVFCYLEDVRLERAFADYIVSGAIDPLNNECCIWLMEIASRMGADEDDCSEIVLKFLENPIKYYDIFIKGKYPNFPSFMSSVARNMALNERKLRRNQLPVEYLSLWGEGIGARKRRDDFLVHLSDFIQKKIVSLPDEQRLILKLRNSIELNIKDSDDLKKVCQKASIPFQSFLADYAGRKNRKEDMHNELINRMNHYNKKILVRRDDSYKESKKMLFYRIERLNHLYSFNELGKLFGVQPRQASVIYNRTLRAMERIYNMENNRRCA